LEDISGPWNYQTEWAGEFKNTIRRWNIIFRLIFLHGNMWVIGGKYSGMESMKKRPITFANIKEGVNLILNSIQAFA
jgi:hypothetical protein